MGELTQGLIRSLEKGGPNARGSLLFVSELLRKAWHGAGGFEPAFQELREEDISNEEATALSRALAEYCQAESQAGYRREALSALAREGRPELRDQLVAELHITLQAVRSLGGDLFQMLLALENVGERPYPEATGTKSIDRLQDNVDAAANYLQGLGRVVPY